MVDVDWIRVRGISMNSCFEQRERRRERGKIKIDR